jgi:protein-L-isoaspartate(D-aspartate) O-methyltransferase
MRSAAAWKILCLVGATAVAAIVLACDGAAQSPGVRKPDAPAGDAEDAAAEAGFLRLRERMVAEQIAPRGVTDPRVIAAMKSVPRHRFVPPDQVPHAYEDRPLPIGSDQTISQPYIVALMSELAEITPAERVLEVGTGSGYQAAVLAAMGAEVYSIEIVADLARSATALLRRLGYPKVHVRHGDGYAGWPEHAPFDAVVVTAAPPRIPEPLKQQLRVGGKLVAPVGRGYQELVVVTRTQTGFVQRTSIPVRFVPMTGRAQDDPG